MSKTDIKKLIKRLSVIAVIFTVMCIAFSPFAAETPTPRPIWNPTPTQAVNTPTPVPTQPPTQPPTAEPTPAPTPKPTITPTPGPTPERELLPPVAAPTLIYPETIPPDKTPDPFATDDPYASPTPAASFTPVPTDSPVKENKATWSGLISFIGTVVKIAALLTALYALFFYIICALFKKKPSEGFSMFYKSKKKTKKAVEHEASKKTPFENAGAETPRREGAFSQEAASYFNQNNYGYEYGYAGGPPPGGAPYSNQQYGGQPYYGQPYYGNVNQYGYANNPYPQGNFRQPPYGAQPYGYQQGGPYYGQPYYGPIAYGPMPVYNPNQRGPRQGGYAWVPYRGLPIPVSSNTPRVVPAYQERHKKADPFKEHERKTAIEINVAPIVETPTTPVKETATDHVVVPEKEIIPEAPVVKVGPAAPATPPPPPPPPKKPKIEPADETVQVPQPEPEVTPEPAVETTPEPKQAAEQKPEEPREEFKPLPEFDFSEDDKPAVREKKKRRRLLTPDEAFTFDDLPKVEKTVEEFEFEKDDRNIETASDEQLNKWLEEIMKEKEAEQQNEKPIIFKRNDEK